MDIDQGGRSQRMAVTGNSDEANKDKGTDKTQTMRNVAGMLEL